MTLVLSNVSLSLEVYLSLIVTNCLAVDVLLMIPNGTITLPTLTPFKEPISGAAGAPSPNLLTILTPSDGVTPVFATVSFFSAPIP
jgi:hypothetical protein